MIIKDIAINANISFLKVSVLERSIGYFSR